MTDTESKAGFTFVLGGHQYNADDLTLLDVADLEDAFDATVAELMNEGRMRPMLHMAWLIRRHTEPQITIEAIGSPTLGQLVDEGEAAAGPPTEAAAAPKRSGSGGRRGTRGSTASARGKSDG